MDFDLRVNKSADTCSRILVHPSRAGQALHDILGIWLYRPDVCGILAIGCVYQSVGSARLGGLAVSRVVLYHRESSCGHDDRKLMVRRWMFIVDAIITIPIAIAGYFFYPDM